MGIKKEKKREKSYQFGMLEYALIKQNLVYVPISFVQHDFQYVL